MLCRTQRAFFSSGSQSRRWNEWPTFWIEFDCICIHELDEVFFPALLEMLRCIQEHASLNAVFISANCEIQHTTKYIEIVVDFYMIFSGHTIVTDASQIKYG